LILVLGVAAYIYRMHAAATAAEVEGVSVAGFTFEGFNPPTDIAPDGLHLTFQVLVYNPTSTPLELNRLTFTVYVVGHHLGEGVREDTCPRQRGDADTPRVNIQAGDAPKIVRDVIWDAVKRGDTTNDYEIKGVATIPVKLFGTIRLLNVNVPFTHKGSYTLPLKTPPATGGWPATPVRAY